jgi:hypothetical protein
MCKMTTGTGYGIVGPDGGNFRQRAYETAWLIQTSLSPDNRSALRNVHLAQDLDQAAGLN